MQAISSPPGSVRTEPPRGRANGYSFVELMVVLVIIGVLAAIGAPHFTRDRNAANGRDFAQLVTRELQRARLESVATRLPQYAFLYSNRVEIRSAKTGATPTAALIAPTTSDPILRRVFAEEGTSILEIDSSTATPSAQLSATSAERLVFSTMGVGFVAPTAPAVPTPLYIFIENSSVPASHPDRKFRVDVAALTGFVQMRTRW